MSKRKRDDDFDDDDDPSKKKRKIDTPEGGDGKETKTSDGKETKVAVEPALPQESKAVPGFAVLGLPLQKALSYLNKPLQGLPKKPGSDSPPRPFSEDAFESTFKENANKPLSAAYDIITQLLPSIDGPRSSIMYLQRWNHGIETLRRANVYLAHSRTFLDPLLVRDAQQRNRLTDSEQKLVPVFQYHDYDVATALRQLSEYAEHNDVQGTPEERTEFYQLLAQAMSLAPASKGPVLNRQPPALQRKGSVTRTLPAGGPRRRLFDDAPPPGPGAPGSAGETYYGGGKSTWTILLIVAILLFVVYKRRN
jgi:hypothetical protein